MLLFYQNFFIQYTFYGKTPIKSCLSYNNNLIFFRRRKLTKCAVIHKLTPAFVQTFLIKWTKSRIVVDFKSDAVRTWKHFTKLYLVFRNFVTITKLCYILITLHVATLLLHFSWSLDQTPSPASQITLFLQNIFSKVNI